MNELNVNAPGSRHTRRAERTREAIVSASLDLFARGGLDGTSIDAIASAVGVTKGALYWHFESKEDLVQAVLDGIRQDWREHVLRRVDAARDPVERIQRLFENYGRLLSDRPQICLFLQRAAFDPDPTLRRRVREVYQQTAKYIARIFEDGKRTGAFRADLDAMATAHAILGALSGAELQCLVNERLSFPRLVKAVEASVLEGSRPR